MDPSLYKTIQVSRGFTYRYFSAKGSGNKTLLFLHGFPNADTDWRHQVSFFGKRGYSLIVPNMLGYGGTSKPTDPADYRQSLMSRDLTNILDVEGVDKAVVVGHDWGAYVAARFANFQPHRTEAVGFITAGYIPPSPVPTFDLQSTFEATKKRLGYEVLGYWEFFASLDAPKVSVDNFDTFFTILWPDKPETWKTDFCPLGALRSALEGKKALPAPSWMSEEDKRLIYEPLLKNGLEAPMCYYKAHVKGFAAEDDQRKAEISQPVFHLDALDDFVGSEETFTTAIGATKSPVQMYCKNATVKRVKVDHWVMLHIPNELNDMLLEWLETF
ncbi:alpha/beta-hydrolase [Marasmius fiardii PR-910]|nr:alpha/beta-hydrolase [Marasmius fiardii PR-910]